MTTVTIHEAKTHLSRLIVRALAGETVTIARGKDPVVTLTPVKPVVPARRVAGRLAHLPGARGILDHGFWEPLSEEDMGFGEGLGLDELTGLGDGTGLGEGRQ